jgi:hypothetical protein
MSSDLQKIFDKHLKELNSVARGLIPVTIELDSTGGRFMLQPLSARPWLKALVVLACFPVFGALALFILFNVGMLWSVLFVIAVLWFFAELRSQPPAPHQIETRFYKSGRIRIESEHASLALPFVGPIWEEKGLILAVVHEHRTFGKRLGNEAWDLLQQLQKRARRLGFDSWKISDLDDQSRTFWPSMIEDSQGEALIRNLFRHVFEHDQKDPANFIIVLGRPLHRDSKGYAEDYDRLLSMFNVMALLNLSRWLSVK